MPPLILPNAVDETVRAHVSAHYPLEACGLLIGAADPTGIHVARAVPCDNVAEPSRRGRRFVIDPREVIEVRRSLRGTGQAVVGFFHSHPDAAAELSATDMEYIRLWPETVWLIVPVFGGEASAPRAWWLDDPRDEAAYELAVGIDSAPEAPVGVRSAREPEPVTTARNL